MDESAVVIHAVLAQTAGDDLDTEAQRFIRSRANASARATACHPASPASPGNPGGCLEISRAEAIDPETDASGEDRKECSADICSEERALNKLTEVD